MKVVSDQFIAVVLGVVPITQLLQLKQPIGAPPGTRLPSICAVVIFPALIMM